MGAVDKYDQKWKHLLTGIGFCNSPQPPYNCYQLKDIADKMESYRVDHLWYYNLATSNTKEARRKLFAILRDDDQRELVFSDNAYKDLVAEGTRFLHKRLRQEKE
jgi:hypothetical protein